MIQILKLSIKDFLSKKYIALSIIPLIVCIVLFGVFLYLGGNELLDALAKSIDSGDFSFLNKYPLIAEILSYTAIKWLVGFIFYTLGAFFVLILSVFVASIVAGFLTPVIVNDLNEKYYRRVRNNEISALKALKISIIEILKFCGIFIICLPLLFVPIINLFIINVPLFYLYYKFLLIDIGSNTLDELNFKIFYRKGGGYKFLSVCSIFYILCLIPLVGFFAQLFFVIFLSHLVMSNEKNYFLRLKDI